MVGPFSLTDITTAFSPIISILFSEPVSVRKRHARTSSQCHFSGGRFSPWRRRRSPGGRRWRRRRRRRGEAAEGGRWGEQDCSYEGGRYQQWRNVEILH